MSEASTFVVRADEAGERVDRFVTARMKHAGQVCTRSDVQRWIADGLVLVDGEAVAKKDKVWAGSAVSVVRGALPLSVARPDASVLFDVVFEDEHLLVVDKPSGLVVHPARGHWTGTLVNGLLARASFVAPASDPRDPEGHLRPGIVHRLDKDTSGVMVVAKTPACREGLKALFAAHDIERSYLAIAIGEVRGTTIDTLHGRHPKSRLRFTSVFDRRAETEKRAGLRRAKTHVTPLEKLGGCSLVRCSLETGRTHQIRVHLAEQLSAPILGDPLYKRNIADPRVAAIGEALGRQALHAAVLGFVHPITGLQQRFETDIPTDMQDAVDALRALDGVSSTS